MRTRRSPFDRVRTTKRTMNVLVRPWRYWGGGAPWGVVWLGLLAGCVVLSVLAAQHDRLPGDLDLTQRLQDSNFPGLRVSKFVRAVTTTQVVLATGGAAAVALWFFGWVADWENSYRFKIRRVS